jgi:hypothetical protein
MKDFKLSHFLVGFIVGFLIADWRSGKKLLFGSKK